MPNPNHPSVTDFYEMSETQKMNILWMGVTELWNKVSGLETALGLFNQILVTGDGKTLPLTERVRNLEMLADTIKYWSRFIGGALVLQTITFGAAVIWIAIRAVPLLEKLANQTP